MNDELSLAYLLNSTFELVNTNGKPLTGGYIEVYIAGSRDKYYCYSDFDGTLHPFKIPLDSLGSNIVLAELDKSYDIYVYNKFGNLVMSRYNVVPVGNGSGSGSIPNITISSNDETVQVENVSAGNFDLSISNTVDRVTALEEAVANIVSDSTAAYSIAHSNTTNNGTFNLTNDGVSGVEYLSDMTGWRLQSGHIYQMNFNAKLVSDVDRDRYIEGKLYLEGIDTVAQEWQFTLDDSYDHTESVNGSTVLYIPSNLPYYDVRLKYDSLVAPTLNKISIVDITSLIEHEQVEGHIYTGVSGVIVDNTNDLILADMDFINSQLNVEAQIASGIQIANEYTDTVVNNVSGDLIQVINEVSGNIPTDYVTHDEVSGVSGNLVEYINEVVETATGSIPQQVNSDWNAVSGVAEILNKPDQITLVAGSNIGIFENGSTLTISASGVETSGFATKTELSTVSGTLQNEIDAVSASIVPQVNSDWDATSGVAEILNKPDLTIYATHTEVIDAVTSVSSIIPTDVVTHSEVSAVSGNLVNTISSVSSTLQNEIENIDLTEYATHSEVNTVSGVLENEIQIVSGAIPTDYVTHNEVSGVSGNIVNYINNVSGNLVDIIETATGNIPEQVNADWNAVSGKAEILNKPDLSIYATNEDLQIVSAAIPDVSEFATRTEVNTVSGQLENEIQTVSGAIPDISNLATKDELNIVSGMIPTDVVTHNEVSAVSGNLVNYVDSASGNLVNIINEVSGNIPEQVQSDWTESDTDSPAYIQHKPDLDVYATKTELVSGLNVVSGMIPDVSDFVTENELETVSGTIVNMIPVVTGYATTQALESVSGTLQNEIETVSGMIPDVSDFATHSELASVSSTLQNEIDSIPEQVNADWDAVSGKAEILNKPEESSLLAGNGISISTSGSDYVISSNAHTYTAGNYISIQNDVISVNGISPQVNSDWKAVAGVQAILNKPDESTLLAGDGIAIAASGTDFVISSTVSAEPQVVTGINKTYYQGLDETFVSKINGYNLQAKVDQYGNVINTTYATKSQVNDLSNRVDAVSAAVSGQIPNIEITSPSGTLVINSSVSGNTKTYSIDVAPSASANGFEYGTFHATNNVTYDATMAKVKGNIDVTNDGKIKLKSGQSYHVTVRGAYNQTTPSDSTSPISYVEYISFDTITLNVDRSVTHSQFFELSYDLFNLASSVDYRILFTGLSGYINELYIDIHSISNSNTVTPVTGGTEYTAGYGIEILNNVISVSGIQPQVNSDWNSNSGKSQILNKPDLSVYATNNDLQVVSAAIPTVTPQVNSDWKAVSGVAQILNKPVESTLIAGDGISIAASGDDFVISATVTGGGGSGVTYNAGDYIDITDNTISVTGITDLVAGNSITITASGASAIISSTGEAQVQSDWDEGNSSSKAYIRNKPSIPPYPEQADWLQSDEWSLSYIKNKPTIPNQGVSGVTVSGSTISLYQPLGFVAGDNISITVSGDSAVISSDVTVTGYATEIEVENVSSTLQTEIDTVSANIADTITLVAGDNIGIFDNGSTIVISASGVETSGFATKTELATVSAAIPTGVVSTSGIVGDGSAQNPLRVDETVLWENESSPLQITGGTAALSEAAYNFRYLRFEYRGEQASGYGLKTQIITNDGRLDSISLGGLAQFYDNYAFSFTGAHISIVDTTLTLVRQGRFNVNDNDTISATDHGNNLFRLVRVVGINRISSNNQINNNTSSN